MRRVFIILGLSIIVVCSIAVSSNPRAQGAKHIALPFAPAQTGAPLELESVTHGTQFLYESAEVKNTSSEAIGSITFGVLLHESGPEWSNPTLVSSRQIQAEIKPGEVRKIDVMDLQRAEIRKKAAAMKTDPVIAEFGILAVELENGQIWNFDWHTEGGFDAKDRLDSRLVTPSSPGCKPFRLSSAMATAATYLLPGLPVVFAQDSYTCVGTPNFEYCTNMLSSCLNTICHKSPTCPKQMCMLIE